MNTIETAPRTLGPELTELVQVRAIQPFVLGDTPIEADALVSVPYHRASYLVFLQLAAWL